MKSVRVRRPTSPASRGMSFVPYRQFLTKGTKPAKALLAPVKKHGGRDERGHISIRHRGGGPRRKFRLLTPLNRWLNQPATVQSIEYDPNRSGFIALMSFEDGVRTYVLAPDGLKVGDVILATTTTPINKLGNRAPLAMHATGVELHDVELLPGQGGKLVRSAGMAATILAHEDDGRYVQLRMPSGEVRRVLAGCYASIGRVSNLLHSAVRIGKAGRQRHLGRRPVVRGKAMNPNSHPHGGGEGVNPIGLKYPKTRWGKHALGVRTRTNKRTQGMILRRRAK